MENQQLNQPLEYFDDTLSAGPIQKLIKSTLLSIVITVATFIPAAIAGAIAMSIPVSFAMNTKPESWAATLYPPVTYVYIGFVFWIFYFWEKTSSPFHNLLKASVALIMLFAISWFFLGGLTLLELDSSPQLRDIVNTLFVIIVLLLPIIILQFHKQLTQKL